MAQRTIEQNVANILRTNRNARDNDVLLVATYWKRYGMASPETITRRRRTLQAADPSLRGKLYDERQAHAGYAAM